MDSTLQIRIDKKTKEEAQKTFRSMGLDLSSGIKMYLSQVINRKEIPFKVLSAEYWSDEKKTKIINESKEAIKNGQGFRTAKDLHKGIVGK
jgi:DNA-damage-inducible protein J